jgi:hypothetical protein
MEMMRVVGEAQVRQTVGLPSIETAGVKHQKPGRAS